VALLFWTLALLLREMQTTEIELLARMGRLERALRAVFPGIFMITGAASLAHATFYGGLAAVFLSGACDDEYCVARIMKEDWIKRWKRLNGDAYPCPAVDGGDVWDQKALAKIAATAPIWP
jgi:hypothetical protein